MVKPVKRWLVHLLVVNAKVSAVGAQPTTSTTLRPQGGIVLKAMACDDYEILTVLFFPTNC